MTNTVLAGANNAVLNEYANLQPRLIGLEEIEETLSRLPFNKNDVAGLTGWGTQIRERGGDICISGPAADDRDTATWLNAGLFVLQSKALGVDILLIKVRDEKGRGKDESEYHFYAGQYASDQWMKGARFRSLTTGLAKIGNLFFLTENHASKPKNVQNGDRRNWSRRSHPPGAGSWHCLKLMVNRVVSPLSRKLGRRKGGQVS